MGFFEVEGFSSDEGNLGGGQRRSGGKTTLIQPHSSMLLLDVLTGDSAFGEEDRNKHQYCLSNELIGEKAIIYAFFLIWEYNQCNPTNM